MADSAVKNVVAPTYQVGKLLVIGCDAGQLTFAFHDFDQVMGVAVGPDQLALENGVPRFVTVLGETNEPTGWRTTKASGGAIIDVPSGETVTCGLCMPHSPRVHNGRLRFCNAGMGNLSLVDRQSGHGERVGALPGHRRGLAVHDGLPLVGWLLRGKACMLTNKTPCRKH